MVNGLSVLGWGVGGIEAEAAMLGQPISMLIPEVIGVEIKGKLLEGLTATDLVLAIVEMLRKKGVVGKFVEFYGEGLKNLTLADRATIANMAPEYGATCGFFPVDEETLKYLKLSGRDEEIIELVEKYSKAQGLWASEGIEFTDTLSLDISTVVPSISGPKRPQDKVSVNSIPSLAQRPCAFEYFSTSSIISSSLPESFKYFKVSSSTGKKPHVAPYSGAMFAIVALSANVRFFKPSP
jgi:aconitate hydratase